MYRKQTLKRSHPNETTRFLMTLPLTKHQKMAQIAHREAKSVSLLINELIDFGLKNYHRISS